MKKLIILILTLLLLPVVNKVWSQGGEFAEDQLKWYRGSILEIISEKPASSLEGTTLKETIQTLKVRVNSGQYKGKIFEVENHLTGQPIFDIKVKKGDRVLLLIDEDKGKVENIYLADMERDRSVYFLLVLFVLAVFLFAGAQGLRSLIGLILTVFLLVGVFLPLAAAGHEPLNLTLLIVGISSLVTFLLVGGLKRKTLAGIMGTWGGIGFSYLLVMYFGRSAYLKGLVEEEAQMLQMTEGFSAFNFQGLIFSAILIGALGAVMDVAMSVASAISEVKTANLASTRNDLIKAGFNVGRDIIGTMTNTLVLAYMGGALPILLLFMVYNPPYIKMINLELISTELIRTLVGSLGLIFTAPITTIIASVLESRR
ncbi:MAG: hypothetical protein DDT22_00974 [candidate division WS2 bacterium]|nr:hypothetical protein [Candidatus Lithacetigena glycinireducens]MBT9175299.1 hypothetical protein [Candidatus Lithacetigena glycinireducens]